MNCPHCGTGRIFREQGYVSCLTCGWEQPVAGASELDMRSLISSPFAVLGGGPMIDGSDANRRAVRR